MCCNRSSPDPRELAGPRAGRCVGWPTRRGSSCSAAGVARYAPWRRCVRVRPCRRRPTTRFSSSTRSVTSCRGSTTAWPTSGLCRISRPCSPPTAYRQHVESRSPGTIPECVGCEVEGLCQGNASTTLVYERATGRAGLFEHRCELIRALTRGVMASGTRRRSPHAPPGASVPPVPASAPPRRDCLTGRHLPPDSRGRRVSRNDANSRQEELLSCQAVASAVATSSRARSVPRRPWRCRCASTPPPP